MKRLADDSKQAEFLLSNVGFFGVFFFFPWFCVCVHVLAVLSSILL